MQAFNHLEKTRPEPDLVLAAGIETIGVLNGGFSREELREARAAVVFDSIGELHSRLADTPLG